MSFFILSLGILPMALISILFKAYNGTFKMFVESHNSYFSNTPEINEQITLDSVKGSIPTWLNGIMFRIGKAALKNKTDYTKMTCILTFSNI
jgi:hypothetical protein